MSRNSVVVNGTIAAVVVLGMLAAAVIVPQLVFRARTVEYTAEFANAAGLSSGAQVDVAGVPAGRVTAVSLTGDRVRITFRLDNAQTLGTTTRVGIKLRTVLGTRYLSVDPAGPGTLSPGATIPESRTSVPYSLDDLNAGVSKTNDLDLAALQRMIGTLKDVAPSDPRLVGDSLTGISAASQVVNQHNQQFRELLRHTQSLTSSLLEQQNTLVTLLGDARLVMDTLNQRRDTIRRLITDVHSITVQLTRLLQDNKAAIDPMLTDLHTVTDTLARNDNAIGETLRQLAPASRYLANATGNGPWGDVSSPSGPLPDNLVCTAGLLKGCP